MIFVPTFLGMPRKNFRSQNFFLAHRNFFSIFQNFEKSFFFRQNIFEQKLLWQRFRPRFGRGPAPRAKSSCFEFSISRKCLGFFYFRTKFGILAWVLLVNLSKKLTWFLLVNLTKNAQNFPALRAESVGVLLLFCEISPKKVGVLLFDGGGYSQYPGVRIWRSILKCKVFVLKSTFGPFWSD